MEDIEHYNIPIYNFPYDIEEDDEDTIEENSELRVSKTEGKRFTCLKSIIFRTSYHFP
jgi:hypothetical protein